VAEDTRIPLLGHEPSEAPDAPIRETESFIASRRREGIVSVEIEAAALLTLGKVLNKPVVCVEKEDLPMDAPSTP
jgi:uridine phosphorylase